MTDDSEKSKKFEFNAADIPGLSFTPEHPSLDQQSDRQADAQPETTFAPLTAPLTDPAPESYLNFDQPVTETPSASEAPAGEPPAQESAPAHEPAPVEASPSETAPADAIQKVKEFSDKIPMEKVQVPAAFPFSLLIEGDLTPQEKEKLLDVLSREQMGFREVDLEPQLAENRILIPRISEYAGILLVQALRGTRAKMRLGPSEAIFSAQDAEVTSDPYQPGMRLPEPAAPSPHERDSNHPAERIAVTPDGALPQLPEFDVIDTIFATAILNSNSVEADRSSEYMEILENLKRELKYKAYRKGAVGLIHFKVDLQQLSLANQYRLMISGAAIRPRTQSSGESVDTINSINSGPFGPSH
jgi:hypothetical protein